MSERVFEGANRWDGALVAGCAAGAQAPGRVRFEQGQRLCAGDLDAAVGAELASGSRHVVGAHRTWGIALGLDARMRDGHEIEISPGVAYDAWGRTLVVTAPYRLVGPTDDATVVVRWSARSTTVRALDPSEVFLGRDVPLASLAKGATELDAGGRRFARTAAQPRIGAGSLSITLTFAPGQRTRDIVIDTRGAAFVQTPSYVITTVGVLALPGRIGPFVSILDPEPAGFSVRFRYAPRPGETPVARSIATRVCWLGVEPRRGCPSGAVMARPPFTILEEGPA